MNAPTNSAATSAWYGDPKDWAQIIAGSGSGINTAMQSNASLANSKREAKQTKKRTLANLLSQATKRRQDFYRAGQEYSDDMNDHQSQSLQQIARGFVEALQGSTG